MTSEQVKKISIVDFLARQSITPDKISHNGQTAIFKSPFRNEKTASFHVDTQSNLWFDHGLGSGGSIVDLVMFLENINFYDALTMLQGEIADQTFSFCRRKVDQPEERKFGIEISSAQRIWHYGLKQYLTERMISLRTASIFVKEVHFHLAKSDKDHFAIGFENVKGGYELRNRYWKGGSSPKFYSFINGASSGQVTIYEGFFDFLSGLELSRSIKPQFDTIVLNSLSNLAKCTDLLSEYRQLNLVLDNDPAGREAVKVFKSHHHNVVNHSERLFPNYKDLNEYLIGTVRSNTKKK